MIEESWSEHGRQKRTFKLHSLSLRVVLKPTGRLNSTDRLNLILPTGVNCLALAEFAVQSGYEFYRVVVGILKPFLNYLGNTERTTGRWLIRIQIELPMLADPFLKGVLSLRTLRATTECLRVFG